MAVCPVCSTECPGGAACPKCGWKGEGGSAGAADRAAAATGGNEHQCAHCGKSFCGQTVSHRGYLDTPTAATPARLGHICSKCGAVSCDACKKEGIGWSTWSGYEKATCQNCSASMEAVSVVVGGSGDLCRAYGGEALLASAPVAEPQGSFSVKGGGEQFLNILWGLVALGGVGAMFFLVILPSRGDVVEFDFKYPALVVGLLAFACWEIVRGIMKLSKIARRRVSLDGNGIRQDNTSVAWPDIRSLKLFRKGDKLKPIAIVNGSEEQTVEVVWATERLDYVMDAIISHLGGECRIEVV